MYPLSLVLICLVIGIYGLLFKPKNKKNILFIIAAFVLLSVFSFEQGKSFMSINKYQWQYMPVNSISQAVGEVPKWIIVLGGGHVSDKRLPASMQLSGDSLARIFEAVRLYNMNKDSKIIVSGAAIFDKASHASVAKAALLDVGIPEDVIIMNDKSKDTLNEARDIAEIVGDDLCYLVTSAIHMQRSAYFFTKKGVNFIPAPTAYVSKQRNSSSVRQYFPQAGEIMSVEKYIHESLGRMWAYILEKIGKL